LGYIKIREKRKNKKEKYKIKNTKTLEIIYYD
jgi:hypothetical protein